MKIIKQSVELIQIIPISEDQMLRMIEECGRTCYKSEHLITEYSAPSFVKMIMKSNHQSVLEHVSLSFRIITDRGVTHELVRHRLASYSQESTRYVKYEDVEFIQPIPELDFEPRIEWLCSCINSEKYYKNMIELGQKPQIARSVLNNSLKTEIVMTANLREWKYVVLPLRSSLKAHPQIRDIIFQIKAILEEKYPIIFKESE
jgi:thymidylate synthase (FAD)